MSTIVVGTLLVFNGLFYIVLTLPPSLPLSHPLSHLNLSYICYLSLYLELLRSNGLRVQHDGHRVSQHDSSLSFFAQSLLDHSASLFDYFFHYFLSFPLSYLISISPILSFTLCPCLVVILSISFSPSLFLHLYLPLCLRSHPTASLLTHFSLHLTQCLYFHLLSTI